MKLLKLTIFVLLLLLSMTLVVQAADPTHQSGGEGQITGTVYTADNDLFPNILVTAYSQIDGDWHNVASTTTDANGVYLLSLDEGTYALKFTPILSTTAPRYFFEEYNIDEATPVLVVAGNTTPNVDIILEASEPFASASYYATGQATLTNNGASLTVSNIGSSGDDGIAFMTGPAQRIDVELEELDATNFPQGATLTIKDIGEVDGIANETLSTMTAEVVGDEFLITSDDLVGNPDNYTVLIYDSDGTLLYEEIYDTMPSYYASRIKEKYKINIEYPDGTIYEEKCTRVINLRLDNVEVIGEAMVTIHSEEAEGNEGILSGTVLQATEFPDFTITDVSPTLYGQLNGTVYDATNSPEANVEVAAYEQQEDSGAWWYTSSTVTDSEGNYSLLLPPRAHILEFVPSDPGLVPQYHQSAYTMDDATQLAVPAGNVLIVPDAHLEEPNYTVTGTITITRDTSQSQAIHQLVDPSVEFYREVATDIWVEETPSMLTITGNSPFFFAATGLTAGNYRLGAEDNDPNPRAFEYYSGSVFPWDDVFTFNQGTETIIGNTTYSFHLDNDSHSVTGQVREHGSGAPIAFVQVTPFREVNGVYELVGPLSAPVDTVTNVNGEYELRLPAGDYKFHYSCGTHPDIFYLSANVTNATVVNISGNTSLNDVICDAPAVPPVAEIDAPFGAMYPDPTTGHTSILVSRRLFPLASDLQISTEVICSNGLPPSEVILHLNTPNGTWTTTMTENPSGSSIYVGTIPGTQIEVLDTGFDMDIEVSWQCTDGSTGEKQVGTIVLYDPSGYITDAATGDPIQNATVTLYEVPNWRPRLRPSDDAPNTCESHNSKASTDVWSQPAPTNLGIVANPYTGRISPATNPQKTDSVGHYGWDVAGGCWYVTVEAQCYESIVSPVVGVPPEVTDLDLVMDRTCPPTAIQASDSVVTISFPTWWTASLLMLILLILSGVVLRVQRR